MKQRKGIWILATALCAVLVTAAVAQHAVHAMRGHGGMGMMMGDNVGYLTDVLDLSTQQQEQMKTIVRNEHAAMKPLFADLMQGHKQVKAAMEAGTLDETQALSIIDQHKASLAKLLVEHAKTHAQIMALLTPDQQTKLKTIQQRHEQKMQEFMQHHQGMQGATPDSGAAPQGSK